MSTAPKKAEPKPRLNLNLLHPQGITPKLPVRFLRWLIAYGRYIVVIVEIVVLACFAFRFKLDEDLNQLKEEINGQVPYLEGLVADDALSNQTHLRLKLIKETYSFADLNIQALSRIAAQTPLTVKVSDINLDSSLEPNTLIIKITSTTSNNNNVALFLNGLKSDKSLSDIGLTSISFDQGNLTFTITGKMQKV